MKLALGSVQYYWPRDKVFTFYEQVAKSAVDIVYVGEAVCSRRHELRAADWLEIAKTLHDAGKQVVLSTQVLIESEADLQAMRRIVENGRFLVEANDMGAAHKLTGQAFVAGPHLNLYNTTSLELVAQLGATRWVMPLEMNRDDLAVMQKTRPQGVETEVFAYGRMPLAFSARCFTARHRNLPKDDCQFGCLDYPDGLLLKTKEAQPFLVLNGIQTQSGGVYNLANEWTQLEGLGVDIVRISPQSEQADVIVDLFDQVRQKKATPQAALEAMKEYMPGAPCNGFWHGKPGQDWVRQN
ncbi:MAG: U32 family peptidase [Oxalobacter sp.]|nr:MAG: U32 family peptidase [Oxalobacter sp.]